MKFFVKLLLKAGIALGVMFIGYKYILTGGLGGFQLPGMQNTASKAKQGLSEIGNAVVDKEVTVYQWVDAQGMTHYGSTPPTGQGNYEKKSIHTSTNLMSAYKIRSEDDEEEQTTQKSRVSRVGSVYSPEGVKDLMEDAKNTEKLLEDRAAAQEKLLNEL